MSFPNLKRGATPREIEDGVNRLYQGKTNNVTTLTLTTSSSTSVFLHPLYTADCNVSLTPTTANAAAQLTTLRLTTRGNKTVTFTHANLPGTTSDCVYIATITG